MRASYGTLQLLGLRPGRYDFTPRAAFFLIGENCAGSCQFCPQSAGQKGQLSRVTWPEADKDAVVAKLATTDLDRICIQGVKSAGANNEIKSFLCEIHMVCKAPVSVSAHIETADDAEGFFNKGADSVSAAIDCANDTLSLKLKGKPVSKTLEILIFAAKKHPSKVTTHLIAGLGESDEELVELARRLIKSNINVSLFAFTPVAGTPLEGHQPPDIKRYRKLQAALALIRKEHDRHIIYKDGAIASLGDYCGLLAPSDFQNPGCKGCNRPYYNERPGGAIYNYPNPPILSEVLKEIEE